MSAVDLLHAALQVVEIDNLLPVARVHDAITRRNNVRVNPSAQHALMWYFAGNGKGI